MRKETAAAPRVRKMSTTITKKTINTSKVCKVEKVAASAKSKKAQEMPALPTAGAAKTRKTSVEAKERKNLASGIRQKVAEPTPHRSWPHIGLDKLKAKFSTNRKGVRWFEKVFWPNGPRCPGCDAAKGHLRPLTGGERRTHRCRRCGLRFGIGTAAGLRATKIDLRTWVIAIHMVATRPGVSSMQMHRDLGITQTTAWNMRHRLLAAHKLSKKGVSRIERPRRTYAGGRDGISNKAEDWEMAAVELALRLPHV